MSLREKAAYIVEKADRNTKGLNYNARQRAQDAYLRTALAGGSESEPLIILALLYSLSNMHDDTYFDLVGTRNPEFLRSDLIEKFTCQLTRNPQIKAEDIHRAVNELVDIEKERVSAKHLAPDAHKEKSSRFITDLSVMIASGGLKKFYSEDNAASIKARLISEANKPLMEKNLSKSDAANPTSNSAGVIDDDFRVDAIYNVKEDNFLDRSPVSSKDELDTSPYTITKNNNSFRRKLFGNSPVKKKNQPKEDLVFTEKTNDFISAMSLYYRNESPNKEEALQKLISIALELSDPALRLNVKAPDAIKALKKAEKNQPISSIDKIYPHVYTVLQAVLETEKSHSVDISNNTQVKNARDTILAVKEILRWLASDEIPLALDAVHTRMVNRLCGNKYLTPEELLAQLDHSKSSEHAKTQIKHASPVALQKLDELPFIWSRLYARGIDEEDEKILEQRRHFEALSVDELKNIIALCDCETNELLTLEQEWLLMTAVTDYDDVANYLKKHPKHRAPAVSPFYKAMQLLALERGEESDDLRDKLCDFAIKSEGKFKANLLEQPSMLQRKMEERRNKLLIKESKAQSELLKTPQKDESSPDDASVSSVASLNSPFHNVAAKRINKYLEKQSLNENEIIDIFENFDAIYHVAPERQRQNLTQLLNKAFEAMGAMTSAHGILSFLWSSPSNTSLNRFNKFSKHIAPCSSLPPYLFARWVDFAIVERKTPEKHEYLFVREHLHRLYKFDNDNDDERKKRSALKGLENNIAPFAQDTVSAEDKTAIAWIYPSLNNELTVLEGSETLLEKELDPYLHLLVPMAKEKFMQDATPNERIRKLTKKVKNSSTNSSYSTPTKQK